MKECLCLFSLQQNQENAVHYNDYIVCMCCEVIQYGFQQNSVCSVCVGTFYLAQKEGL